MKAALVYSHKSLLQGRYVLEMEIHQVGKSARYRDGVKSGLVLVDLHTEKKVLMDNHHPKGPHVHLNDREVAYHYTGEDSLIRDFKTLVLEHMGVKI